MTMSWMKRLAFAAVMLALCIGGERTRRGRPAAVME